MMAVTGAVIVYWVLMSNFLENTVDLIARKSTYANYQSNFQRNHFSLTFSTSLPFDDLSVVISQISSGICLH